MIVFGVGQGRVQDHGPTLPVACPRCHNQVMYHYMTRTRWFGLFFIPIIPYSRRHLLLCPICSHGARLEKEDLERVRALNTVAIAYEAGSVGEEDLRRAVEAYGRGHAPELPLSALPAVEAAARPLPAVSKPPTGPVPLEPVPAAVNPPAGWYADPAGTRQLRWWDGKGWSSHFKPAEETPG